MGKAKKAKNAKLPGYRLNAKAKNAAGAAATAGRARTFADKGDKLAKETGDAEIDDGIAEYSAKKKPLNIYIVAAESHCGEKRVFSEEQAQDYCKEHGLLEYAADSKTIRLQVVVKGTSESEIEFGLEEVLRLVKLGNEEGRGGVNGSTFYFKRD